MEAEPLQDVVRAVAPGVAKSSLQVGAITGGVGAVFGGVVGTFRGSMPILYATASSVQCFGIGTVYWGIRQSTIIAYARNNGTALSDVSRAQRKEASTLAGAFTGLLAGALRGRANILPGTLVFSLAAFGVQDLYDRMDKNQLEQSDKPRETIVGRLLKSRISPVKLLSDEDYRKMLQEKQIRIEAEIAILDEHIAALEADAERQKKTPSP